ESVQQTIVRRIFLVARPAGQSSARRPDLTAQHRNLQAIGGSSQAASQPQPQAHSGARKLGRNDPCWCGSGKKYKDCHWRADQQAGKIRYIEDKAEERRR
ncbi:MAG: SEC-C domain-containing protein, partial [Anaerolineae bacterium]|nr:SEC-C domain-containing protein [Anaerolineae bacterium]